MKRTILAILAPFALVACVGTDVGNPPATTEIGFEPTTDETGSDTRTATGALTLPNDYEITEAWLAIDFVTLRDAQDCSRSGDTDSVGPYFVNLAGGGEVFPEAPRVTTPSGDYCEVRLELAAFDDVPAEVGAPFALRGKSIFIRGIRPDGTNFAISSDRAERIRYKSDGNDTIAIDPGANRFVSVFNTSTWVRLTELDAVSGDAVEVSPRDNPQLYGEFRGNFLHGSELFRDDDRNGRLDLPEKAKAIGRPEAAE